MEMITWEEEDSRRASLTSKPLGACGPGKVRSRVLTVPSLSCKDCRGVSSGFPGEVRSGGVRMFQPPLVGVGWAAMPAFQPHRAS